MRQSLWQFQRRIKPVLICLVSTAMFAFASFAQSHGSVVDGAQGCSIELDFYTAFFDIYQPERTGHRAYCEDIPVATNTLFVMEYQHNAMRDVPVEFRIIRNDSRLGRFIRWSDIEQIEDLDSVTVYYQSAPPRPDGVLSIQHAFAEEGDYVGIVSAPHPEGSPTYHAVFPFHVGSPLIPLWGWPVLAVCFLFVWRQYRKRTQPPKLTTHSHSQKSM